MKKLIFIVILILLPVAIKAQNTILYGAGNSGFLYSEELNYHSLYAEPVPQRVDSLEIRKNAIYYQGRIATTLQLCRIMKPNREASVKVQGAVALRVVSSIAAGVGGFCLGYSIGNRQMTKEQKKGFIWTGVGCLAVAFPVAFVSDHMMKDAVKIYNKGLRETSYVPRPDIRIEFAATGAGVKIRF